jgi:hypothetical protein
VMTGRQHIALHRVRRRIRHGTYTERQRIPEWPDTLMKWVGVSVLHRLAANVSMPAVVV